MDLVPFPLSREAINVFILGRDHRENISWAAKLAVDGNVYYAVYHACAATRATATINT
jgi:hypothetical protein